MKKPATKKILLISASALVIVAILAVCFDRFVFKLSLAKSLGRYYPIAVAYRIADEKCEFNPLYNKALTTTPEILPHRNFIAHAGGAILKNAQGKPQTFTYTNSKEALLQSLQEGFSFIELDLMLDSSGGIFAAHDYKHFYSITGRANMSGDVKDDETPPPPSKQEILDSKIYGFLTPLTAESITQIFQAHPRAYLVTDKLNDFDAIKTQLPFTDRILIEVFSLRGYYKARKMGLKPMLSTSDIALAKRLHIPMVATHTSTIASNPQLAEEYIAQGGCIMAFSSNEKAFIERHKDRSATMFYTDYFDINSGECKLEGSRCKTY